MRPPSCLALVAAVLSPLVVLSAGGASAQTAEPTPGPTASPTASPTTSPTAAAAAAPATTPPPVDAGDAQDSSVVRLVPGQQLRIGLSAAPEPWQGLEASSTSLQVLRYDARSGQLSVTVLALAPAPAQRLVATAGERRWELLVEVGPGEPVAPRSCGTPAPTGMPTAPASATALPSASATPPNGRPLYASSDGQPYTIADDEPVTVLLDDCARPYGPVTVEGPLRRVNAFSSVVQGEADAYLSPTGAGTATLTAQRDAPCASRPGAVCPTPWRVVLTIEDPCDLTLTGPASVPVGGTVQLAGRAEQGQTVSVLFRRRGESVFTVRRTLTAGPDGAFSTTFAAVDDHRYYAQAGRCVSVPVLTQVLPTVTAPARVARGAQAVVDVRAAAGSRVEVLFRRAGTTTPRVGRTGTADAAGRFRTSFRPDVDHALHVRSLGRSSAARVVQAR